MDDQERDERGKLPPYVQRMKRKTGPKFRGWAVIDGRTVVGTTRETPEEAHQDGLRLRERRQVNELRNKAEEERAKLIARIVEDPEKYERYLGQLERETDLLERRAKLRRQRGKGSRLAADGHVYFIADSSKGLVKIGFARDVTARFAQVRTDNPSDELELLASFHGSHYIEGLIHDAFAEHRVKGEWFRLSKSIVEFIRLRAEHDANRVANRRKTPHAE